MTTRYSPFSMPGRPSHEYLENYSDWSENVNQRTGICFCSDLSLATSLIPWRIAIGRMVKATQALELTTLCDIDSDVERARIGDSSIEEALEKFDLLPECCHWSLWSLSRVFLAPTNSHQSCFAPQIFWAATIAVSIEWSLDQAKKTSSKAETLITSGNNIWNKLLPRNRVIRRRALKVETTFPPYECKIKPLPITKESTWTRL